ncbi:MAG: beta-propeller fold lactonase family protein, partial [Dehalococcoidia bacterium]
STIGVMHLQTGVVERIIALPLPFGLNDIAMDPQGKFLYSTGALAGRVAKIEIATGKSLVLEAPPAPSAPNYLEVSKDGKYVFATNAFHSTVMVFRTEPFELVKELPVGKNPQGVDATPDGKWILVSDKLSATMTVIDAQTLTVHKVLATGAGPLHTVIDRRSKYAYQSCYIADSIVKIDLETMQVVDEFPVHYRPGHLVLTPDEAYLISLNTYSTGLWQHTDISASGNIELLDVNQNSPTYGKTLKQIPFDGEPHNGKLLVSRLMPGGAAARLITAPKPALFPRHRALSRIAYVPVDLSRPGKIEKHGVMEFNILAFSYGYIPRKIRVVKGDKVRLFVTNIDIAAGLTKNPDVTHGFIINGAYALQTNVSIPPGVSVMIEFVADKAGEYEFYNPRFSGPLATEMRGTFFVDGPDEDATLAEGDYEAAQKHRGLLEPGQTVEGERVTSFKQ